MDIEEHDNDADDDDSPEILQPAEPWLLLNYAGDRVIWKDTKEGWQDPTIHVHDTAPIVPSFEDHAGGKLAFDTDGLELIDYFYHMFPKSLFNDIAAETNCYHGTGAQNQRHGK